MKFVKFSLLLSLLFSACVPNQAIESQSSVSKETSSEENNNSDQNQASSSSNGGGSGGSSGGSSSSGSSASSGKTSPPSQDSNSQSPPRESRYDFNQTSFASNTLTTPLFKIQYHDPDNISDKNSSEKEEFLKRMYKMFLDMTIYGNEAYTVSNVIFEEKRDLSAERQWGKYEPATQEIKVLFDKNTEYETIFSILNHEYYHHLTFLRMEKVMQVRFNQQINKNESDFNTYEKYMKLLNDGERQFEQNWQKNYANFPYWQAWTYEHERIQYYDEHFSKTNRNTFLTFERNFVVDTAQTKINGNVNANFYNYLSTFDEFLVSTMNLYTILFSKRKGSLVELSFRNFNDYLWNLFMRTNIYYEYDNDLRKYPSFVGTGRNGRVTNHLQWSEIKDFKEATSDQMNDKWTQWKKYFTEVLFNNDELLSDAFMDQANNLYLELNLKDANISFVNTATGETVTPTIVKLQNPTQVTFNLKPYQQQAKSFVNSYAYKIKDNALAVGEYKIKIGNQYLTEEQGLNLKNRSLKYKNIFSRNNDRSIPVIKEYKFYLKDNHIVLEVCKLPERFKVSGCQGDS